MKHVQREALEKSRAKVVAFLTVAAFSSFTLFTEEGLASRNSGNKNFYASGTYRMSTPDFGELKVRESLFSSTVKTEKQIAMKTGILPDYNSHDSFDATREFPSYRNDNVSFSGAVGYKMGPMRFEIEGFSNEFSVDLSEGGILLGGDKSYIALVRAGNIQADNYVVVDSTKVGISSATLNACYDFESNVAPVSSYLCLGISGNVLNLLGANKISHGYYGKTGFGVFVTPDTMVWLGVHYNLLHRDSFDTIVPIVPTGFTQTHKATFVEANVKVAHLGGELGMRYMF